MSSPRFQRYTKKPQNLVALVHLDRTKIYSPAGLIDERICTVKGAAKFSNMRAALAVPSLRKQLQERVN